LIGLSSQQAQQLLQEYGPNRLQQATQRALLLQFMAHFRNPLLIVLLCASALSALTGEPFPIEKKLGAQTTATGPAKRVGYGCE
jgi:magnesium-transporting ATPase (P-type)